MDKYYTPKIEEFYVGFEFENRLTIGDNWFKCIADWDLLDNTYDDFEHNFENILNLYRVKYLDKEDIESLGFVISSNYGAGNEFKFGDRYKLVKVKFEGLTYSKNEIRIFENNSIFGEDYNSRLFIGNIKNKSELIKLLKQLQIG